METLDLCLRLGTALVLGALIGLERQLRQGLGGIRVYTLVSFGSALFVLSGAMAVGHDYSRAAAQVVSGIGFICAGMIFKHGISVRGLNQAATIWASSAIGVLAGAGLFLPAVLGAVGILFVNLVIRSFSQELEAKLLDGGSDLFHYQVEVECKLGHADTVRLQLSSELSSDAPIRLTGISSEEGSTPQVRRVRADYASTASAEDEMQRLVGRVGLVDAVKSIRWKKVSAEASAIGNGRL